MHPGSVRSDLQRYMDEDALEQAKSRAQGGVVWISLEQGASTSLVAALDPGLENVKEVEKVYMANCGFEEPSAWCVGGRGQSEAERLWSVSEGLVGEKFAW